MKKILLSPDAAEGGTTPPAAATATPPIAAAVAAAGKTENEIRLERENAKLKAAVAKTADSKRRAEETAAHTARENQKLKEVQLDRIKPAPVAPAKASSWGFFTE